MDAGQKLNAMLARNNHVMGSPCVGRSAGPCVAGLRVPVRGREADAARNAACGKSIQVAHPPVRCALPAERMPSLHYRFQAVSVVALRPPLQHDVAENPGPAARPRIHRETLRQWTRQAVA